MMHRLCLTAIGLAAIAAVAWRVRWARLARSTATITERERAARDRHDSLLQNMQGLMYQFQAAIERLPAFEPARLSMEKALDRVDELLAEARAYLSDVDDRPDDGRTIEEELRSVATHLCRDGKTAVQLTVQGEPRQLLPMAARDLKRIGTEALINAFTHAAARCIEGEIVYETRDFLLRIRDDGHGFDAQATRLKQASRQGGLIDMHARAQRLNASLEVWSGVNAGTEISCRVPAPCAYEERAPRARRWTGL